MYDFNIDYLLLYIMYVCIYISYIHTYIKIRGFWAAQKIWKEERSFASFIYYS